MRETHLLEDMRVAKGQPATRPVRAGCSRAGSRAAARRVPRRRGCRGAARSRHSSASGATTPGTAGPNEAYRCSFNVNTDAFTGADGTASAIGWLGDHNSVVTCLGGTFLVQDGPSGLFQDDGFGVYDGQRTTWADADGYLPAQVTTFDDAGTTVAITEFADEVTLGGHPFVAVYSRVRVTNPTAHAVVVDPAASPALLPLDDALGLRARSRQREPRLRGPRGPLRHRRRVAEQPGAGRRGRLRCALHPHALVLEHAARMRSQQISVPDQALVDAYKSGFITTQITRSGDDLDTGVNGYESEFSHDVVGILTNLFTQGYFTDAHALLTEARNVVGAQGQYVDGLWTYAVPWAVYLMKTGDSSFVAQNFANAGPGGAAAQPSIEDAAHAIATDRTGPQGTMEATDDIDTQGYWTVDDYEALLGLAAYRYVATTIGNTTEASWAALAIRQPARRHRRRARADDQPEQTGLSPLLAGPAEHGQPVRQPARRQLDVAVRLRQLGVGGLTARGHGHRTGPDADRRHLRLRVRPPAGPASRRHDGRFPRRLLLERLRRGQRRRPGWLAPPIGTRASSTTSSCWPTGRAGPLSWWESSTRTRSQLALGRPPPRRGAGVVAPCVGHGGRQQGAARLSRRAASRAARWSSGAACPPPGCTQAPHRSP